MAAKKIVIQKFLAKNLILIIKHFSTVLMLLNLIYFNIKKYGEKKLFLHHKSH
jgi:hypothetical protein